MWLSTIVHATKVVPIPIKRTVHKNERIEDAVRALIDQANENGGKDNVYNLIIMGTLNTIRNLYRNTDRFPISKFSLLFNIML